MKARTMKQIKVGSLFSLSFLSLASPIIIVLFGIGFIIGMLFYPKTASVLGWIVFVSVGLGIGIAIIISFYHSSQRLNNKDLVKLKNMAEEDEDVRDFVADIVKQKRGFFGIDLIDAKRIYEQTLERKKRIHRQSVEEKLVKNIVDIVKD